MFDSQYQSHGHDRTQHLGERRRCVQQRMSGIEVLPVQKIVRLGEICLRFSVYDGKKLQSHNFSFTCNSETDRERVSITECQVQESCTVLGESIRESC